MRQIRDVAVQDEMVERLSGWRQPTCFDLSSAFARGLGRDSKSVRIVALNMKQGRLADSSSLTEYILLVHDFDCPNHFTS